MDVYVRPVIPWSLECELNGVASRLDAIEYFERTYVTDRNYRNVHGHAVAGIIIMCIGVIIFCDKNNNSGDAIVFGIICSVILVDLIFFAVIKKLNDHRKDALDVETIGSEFNQMLRSCADRFTQFDLQTFET